MSTKELHVLQFWLRAAKKCFVDLGAVSAGQVGKYVGQSRKTAKKYLDRLVSEGALWSVQEPARNGVMATLYGPTNPKQDKS